MAKRNNGARTAAPQAAPPAPQFSGALSFTNPTEFVELPTQGKFYPEGHPLHLKTEVEIRYMSAKEEDILTSQALISRGIVIDRLIQSVLVDSSIDVNTLYPGDKSAIMIAARATGYGSEYVSNVKCPSCGTNHDHVVDLVNIPIKEVPDDLTISPAGTFSIVLPRSGFTAEIRILSAKQQSYLENMRDTNRKNNLPERNRTDFLKMVIVSVNSISARQEVENFIDNMPAMDSREVKKAYDRAAPSLQMEQRIECPSCQHVVVRAVPLGIDFFWPS